MGFNFHTGHPTDVYEDEHAATLIAALRSEFGDDLPLGRPGQQWSLDDEMGWSWWGALQEFAAEKLGESGSRYIGAVDAWNGAYIDAAVDRTLLWPNGQPDPDSPPRQPTVNHISNGESSWLTRLLQRLGLRQRSGLPPEMDDAIKGLMNAMREAHGARPGEDGAVQVANLRALKAELDALLNAIDVEPAAEAVEALRRSYSDSDDRCDDDPHIQCLCHAWLTATRAIEEGTPMWLIK